MAQGKLIQIVNYDLSPYMKVLLSEDVAKNDTSIKVNGVEGFTANSRVLLGINNNYSAEVHTVQSIPDSNTIVLSAGAKYPHLVNSNEMLYVIPFDQIKLYYGASEDNTDHSYYATFNIEFFHNMTTIFDSSSPANVFFSYTLYNSVNQNETQRINCNQFGISTDITPQYVRENFLYGLDLTDSYGNPLPESLYWHGILAAYHWLERELLIDIIERTYTKEEHDYRRSNNFIQLQTYHYPIQEITEVRGHFYSQDIIFPNEWIRTYTKTGIVHIVPTQGVFNFLVNGTSSLVPLMNSLDYIPNYWQITYKTGFSANTLPYDLRDIVCKKACYMPLNILGDLVGGVAVASKSIGVDGLSQSLNTTSSAENSGYSARLKTYATEIKTDLHNLKTYYMRQSISII